ncbi:MAG TPA: PP2C family serine/threonine-protein phosphatase [Microbacteriaceae bacterium]|nr:PP2C family serine/threonine-protein phosphatase [Microbacteriaceae bacterium]
MPSTRAHAISDVGLTRSNNQDSGYAGRSLFVVADGMGGHAGGDVASAVVVQHLLTLDEEYATPSEAEQALHNGLLTASDQLADLVAEHPELTGMGTTVSAIALVGRSAVIAHIGDSRIYRLRDGQLTQLTSDHTFVQRLVETGRITPEEALHHPRRSVLMRVLGDVDAVPEIDTMIFDTRPGDRWLLCSDGLASYVEHDELTATMLDRLPTESTAATLLTQSLNAGAPDNVTIILLDIGDDLLPVSETQVVGSASQPLQFDPPAPRRPKGLPALLRQTFTPQPVPESHFEPETDEYLAALIIEDRKRLRRRRATAITVVVLSIAAIVVGLVAGYNYTQSLYYVGEHLGKVALYRGVQQDLGPIELSHLVTLTDILVEDLPPYRQSAVIATISTDSLQRADEILQELSDAARR